MTGVVIAAAGRSPIGKRNGSLARTHPSDTLGPVSGRGSSGGASAAPDFCQAASAAPTFSLACAMVMSPEIAITA